MGLVMYVRGFMGASTLLNLNITKTSRPIFINDNISNDQELA